jgi:2,3-bisphosphoglycerate-dependent phosphoglycerate mutase
MSKLVILRHGQSQWNLENRFTGWMNIDLTAQGETEARRAGVKLKDYTFDFGFSSALIRAQKTLDLVLESAGHPKIPITYDAALNERMYGELQGLNKDETVLKYGAEQVKIWRRSYDIAPPGGESLKDTAQRVIPYFQNHIAPLLKQERNVIIAAHGNSLRALIMHVEDLSPEEILAFELGTAQPRCYTFNTLLKLQTVAFI